MPSDNTFHIAARVLVFAVTIGKRLCANRKNCDVELSKFTHKALDIKDEEKRSYIIGNSGIVSQL